MFPYTNVVANDPRGLWFDEQTCKDFGVSSIFFESLIENARNYIFPDTVRKYIITEDKIHVRFNIFIILLSSIL
jgi:hypothetical protein